MTSTCNFHKNFSLIFELQKYRSEFFGKLQNLLGDREDIKIVGDRFIFESELLFDSASADLQLQGMDKLKQIGLTLKETTNEIPSDIDWIIQVEGHTDNSGTKKYNQKLSEKRAETVAQYLRNKGKNKLSYRGFGQENPGGGGDTPQKIQHEQVQNLQSNVDVLCGLQLQVLLLSI